MIVQRTAFLILVAQFVACLLIAKTTIVVLGNFPDYFPADFRADFLLGRKDYFYGPYSWAFYVHILSGPFSLVAGLMLLNETIRRKFPAWHRNLGKVQIFCVLTLVVPSGLWMSAYAMSGWVAGGGFAAVAILTGVCAAQGWRWALQKRFDRHRRWMLRCYILLCSAVSIRVIGGVAQTLQLDWTYPYAAWLSWLAPLIVLETLVLRNRFLPHPQL